MTNNNNSDVVQYYDTNGTPISHPAGMANHGPSNQAGLTSKEYYEMLDLESWEREKENDWY